MPFCQHGTEFDDDTLFIIDFADLEMMWHHTTSEKNGCINIKLKENLIAAIWKQQGQSCYNYHKGHQYQLSMKLRVHWYKIFLEKKSLFFTKKKNHF